MKKIWFIICSFLSFYCLGIFLNERYRVDYEVEKRINEDIIQKLICYNLSDLIKNFTEIDLIDLNYELYKIFKFKFKKIKDSAVTRDDDLNVYAHLLEQTKLKNYLIFKKLICFDITNPWKYIIFKYSSIFNNVTKNFFFNPDSLEFFENSFSEVVSQIIVLNKKYPYSNCTELNYAKVVNECIKKRQRLSNYFYWANETGPIILKYALNSSILENEKHCLKNCDRARCAIDSFVSSTDKDSKTTIFKAYAVISSFDFYLNFIGLIFLFLNVPLNRSMHFFFYKLSLSSSRLKRKFKIYKILIILFNLILIFLIYTKLILEYIEDRDNPKEREIQISTIERGSLTLVICIPFSQLFKISYDDFQLFVQNKTLQDIETLSDLKFFNGKNIEIHLGFKNKKLEIDWKLLPDVIYFSNNRCFKIKIFPIKKQYWSLLSLFKLTVQTNYSTIYIYMMPDYKPFNSKSFLSNPDYQFVKRIVKKSTKNTKKPCVDYEKMPFGSRWSSIDQCINSVFIRKYGCYSFNLLVHKSQFLNKWMQWSKILYSTRDESWENGLDKIKQSCVEKFKRPSCNQAYFAATGQVVSFSYFNEFAYTGQRSINLFYDLISIIEEEPSIQRLLFDMLNIQTIIFGLNCFKLFKILLFINFKHKMLLINLICFVGFCFHCWFIFDQIIHAPLVFNQHYKSPKWIDLPEIILCFKYDDSSINLVQKSNKTFMDQFVSDLKIEKVFENVKYLGQSDKWFTLNRENKYSTKDLKIDSIYYNDKKCFLIEKKISYYRKQFYFKPNNQVLKFFFNKSLIYQKSRLISFLTKIIDTKQFSKIISLNFVKYTNKNTNLICSIRQKDFEIIYNDRFNVIKNLFSFFFGGSYANSMNERLNDLINDFERSYNLKVLDANIHKSNYELDEAVLNDLINKTEQKKKNYSFVSNYRKRFAINYLQIKDHADYKPDLTFSIVFLRRVIMITNDESFSNLIINLLNLLSFYCNVGVLDLYFYIEKSKFLIFKSFDTLKVNLFKNH